jgi:hypothetical protein
LPFEKGHRVGIFLSKLFVKFNGQTGRKNLYVMRANLSHLNQEFAVLGLKWMSENLIVKLVLFVFISFHKVHRNYVQLDVIFLDS